MRQFGLSMLSGAVTNRGTMKIRPWSGGYHKTNIWIRLVCKYKQDSTEFYLHLFSEGECTKYLRGWHLRPVTCWVAEGTLRLELSLVQDPTAGERQSVGGSQWSGLACSSTCPPHRASGGFLFEPRGRPGLARPQSS